MDNDARQLERPFSLEQFCQADVDALFWIPERRGSPSAWWGHVPFAEWLMSAARPRVVVELGTEYGVSYTAFCQSVVRCQLNTHCYAVDTWQGDKHAGHYGEQVYEEFRLFHDERYAAFSTLLRCTFDDALERIADGSVDLLHIDGLHTYDAVHHDFESWRPKLSPRAVVLFHDINVHRDDFGVWRVWQQLTTEYPHFQFNHCYGLGVLAIGSDIPPAVAALCALNATDEGAAFRNRVALIGARWMADAREHDLHHRLAAASGARGAAEAAAATAQAEIAAAQAEIAAAQAQAAQRDAIIGQLHADAAERVTTIQQLEMQTAQQDALAEQLRAEAAERSRTIRQLQSQATGADATIADLRQRLDAIEQSTTWRATAGVRAMAKRLPNPVRHNLRRAARVAYRLLILHRMPSRLRFRRDQRHPWAAGAAQDLISRRYADIRTDIKARLASPTPLRPQLAAISDGPLISIVLPVFRPPLPLIEKTISSVLRQSYPHWELCIVDDGSQQPQLAQRLQHYAGNDGRIKLRVAEANAGISSATNLALSLATGSHVAFLDHDDLLTCDALECIARVIADEPNVDLIYSDECKIDEQDEPRDIFPKPDWSPALMLNCMYIGHLAVYRRSLITTLGGLRSGYDFSQDYDLALRASEQAVNVRHVDRILYGWRMTERSAAAGGKPYARQSNIAALQDALARRSYDARAVALPTANYACWTREALRGRVSIIIPSDDAGHITQCLQSIQEGTAYADYELVVVTRSTIARDLADLGKGGGVRFVEYDQPFNFSDKCNVGAAAATGEYVVFLNDDVRVITGEWIEALLECLQVDGIAASSPKLLYEDGTIQHAGLVTGVRGLVGTAFHCLPADTGAHFNFAQSLRETSAISAACLALRRDVFFKLGAFDAAHVPINHSDIDLCFRLREEGYRCLYTPHATLRHIGHQSLAAHDAGNGGATRRAKDKADIYLLRRWPKMVAYDPYFPPAMRDLLYADSPEDYKIYPAGSKRESGGLDILILSHDLTNSGAPRLVFDMARVLTELGHFVVVMSPTDGPYRVGLVSLGITVIVDSLLLKGHHRFPIFARNFDRVIANTAVMLPAVRQLSRQTDVYWYIHESQFIADHFSHRPDFVQALHEVRAVWAASKRAHRFLRGLREDVDLLEYGVDPAPGASRTGGSGDRPAMFAVIGSYEPRKGQDLAIKGIRLLPKAIRRECRFDFFGRVLDSLHHAALRAIAADIPEIHLGPELSHDDCLAAIREADIILSPSRDDTLPFVSLDALAAGKILMCTAETGTSEYLKHMQSFIRIDDPSPEAVCAAITAAFEARARWSEIAECGHRVFVQEFSRDAFVKRLTRCLDLAQPDVDPGFGLAENRTRAVDDEWRPVDRDDHREGLAQRWLRGSGLEIGALHKPVQLARGVKVTYVDYKTADENRLRYPELAGQSLVQTDLIDDGFTLDKVADASQDFIIANHALEHSPDLCGTVACWLSKLRRGGILYFALPIAERCYDRGRPLTTLEHLRRDHDDFVLCNIERVIATTAAHIDEFIRISDRNIRSDSGMPPAEPAQIATLRDQLIDGLTKQIAGTALDHRSLIQAHVLGINKVYDVHYHTFSPSSLYGIMNALSGELGFTIAEYCKSGGGEVIAVLRKS